MVSIVNNYSVLAEPGFKEVLFHATTTGLTMPQPTKAGSTPAMGGSVKWALQPMNDPNTPSAMSTAARANARQAQILSNTFIFVLPYVTYHNNEDIPPSPAQAKCGSIPFQGKSGFYEIILVFCWAISIVKNGVFDVKRRLVWNVLRFCFTKALVSVRIP